VRWAGHGCIQAVTDEHWKMLR